MTPRDAAELAAVFAIFFGGLWLIAESKRREDEILAAKIDALCREIERSWEDPRVARVRRILAGLEK